MSITIMVMAHDRPVSLARLLASLRACNVPPTQDTVDVIISIDGGSTNQSQVEAVASEFAWPHGNVDVVGHDHLGLVDHFRWCGDRSTEVGDIVLLEDDLVVGPNALTWAAQALDASTTQPRTAAVCLSAPRFDGFRHQPFEPLHDGSDAVHAKVMWFHGLAFTPDQWASHRGGADADRTTRLPEAFDALGDDEWFPDAVRSLVENDAFCLMPRVAHAVNFGDAGVHFSMPTDTFQQPLALGPATTYRLRDLDDPDASVYDEFMEFDGRWLSGRVDQLRGLDIDLDTRAVRPPQHRASHTVTTRVVKRAMATWATAMHPLEQNLVMQVEGKGLSLSASSDVVYDDASQQHADELIGAHARYGRPTSRAERLGARIGRLMEPARGLKAHAQKVVTRR